MESIVNDRIGSPNKGESLEELFLVKYKFMSYLETDWLTEDQFKSTQDS